VDGVEVRVSTPDNAWVCELGRAADWGDLDGFAAAVLGAGGVTYEGDEVRYRSPSRGVVGYGWRAPLTVDGVAVPHDGSLRFDNPYARVPVGAGRIVVSGPGEELEL